MEGIAEADTSDDGVLQAGDFSSWMIEMQAALRGERDSDVPCGTCTACCTSSQFIHIGPDETDTLANVPAELLFPAPRMPKGHVLLGYDQRGHCPMLIDNRCSIYQHRPRTCRIYDCRVFPAAGLEPEGDDKAPIAQQVRRWRFGFASPADENQHAAVQAAATFLSEKAELITGGGAAATTTQLAVMAIEVHDCFVRHDQQSEQATFIDPDPDVVRIALGRRGQSRIS